MFVDNNVMLGIFLGIGIVIGYEIKRYQELKKK